MAFGVTSEGFKAKKFEDIIAEIAVSLKTQLGIDIDANPDSIAKVITNIYSLALAEEWALPQGLQSMFDIGKSEGKHLDDLVGYIGLTRLSAASSFGDIYLTSTQATTIPANTTFEDVSGDTYSNLSSFDISLSACVGTVAEVDPSVIVGDVLSINLASVVSQVVVTTTVASAVTALVLDINTNTINSGYSATDTTSGGNPEVTISKVDDRTQNSVIYSSNFNLTTITSFGEITKDVVGEFIIVPNTVTTPPSITGITSSTNRYVFITGRYDETDQQLRARHKLSLSFGGTATVDAIRSDILRVLGVVTTIIVENDTLTTTSIGQPPKSVLCVVKGGADNAIAQSIWDNKPAGIQTFGSTTEAVTDSQGNTQFINFSRPSPVYTHVRVDYSLYNEQSSLFPVNGEQQISDLVISYGESLKIGEDVIPQRFSSEIFQGIQGLAVVNITIGSTVNPSDPTPPLSSNVLSISDISESNFSATRITISEI